MKREVLGKGIHYHLFLFILGVDVLGRILEKTVEWDDTLKAIVTLLFN